MTKSRDCTRFVIIEDLAVRKFRNISLKYVLIYFFRYGIYIC
jgi:hypothetical protein